MQRLFMLYLRNLKNTFYPSAITNVIFQLSDWNLHGFYARLLLLLLLLLFSLMRKRSFGIIKIRIIEEKKTKNMR